MLGIFRVYQGLIRQLGIANLRPQLFISDFWLLEKAVNLENFGVALESNGSNMGNYKSIYIWVRVKIQGMDQGPGPTHDPYPPIHTLIHTP